MSKTYHNPVMPGFFPDPSVVRVGEDYYMVNSTFQYFPGIIISHSRDLVHWEHIGHVLTEPAGLDWSGLDDSCGVWAPDISYHNGAYYVFFSFVQRRGKDLHITNCATSATLPTGHWSTPAALNHEGIDPSHFVDHGRHYMLVNPGARCFPLNDDCTATTGKGRTLWDGETGRSPEGPHLLKKGCYYYLLLAEGGTGHGHRITAARARRRHGPYEPCPRNPILMQTDENATIQKTGHGKWVQTQTGDWWIVYLCARPCNGRFSTLGRETCLDPLTWGEDGWPVINHDQGPSTTQACPDLPETPLNTNYSDDFSSTELRPQWQFIRRPDPSWWSLTERPGLLRLRPGPPLCRSGPVSALLQRERSHHYRAETVMEFNPASGKQEAGITCYYGRKNHLRCGVGCDRERYIHVVHSLEGELARHTLPACDHPITLRVEVDGLRRTFSYRTAGMDLRPLAEIPDCSFLSDEAIVDDFNFTGTMVGMYACREESEPYANSRPADFQAFSVLPQA